MVVGDEHVHGSGDFPERFPPDGRRGDPLGEKGPLGEDGIGEPIFPPDAHEKGAVSDPDDKIHILRQGLDPTDKIGDDSRFEGPFLFRVIDFF